MTKNYVICDDCVHWEPETVSSQYGRCNITLPPYISQLEDPALTHFQDGCHLGTKKKY